MKKIFSKFFLFARTKITIWQNFFFEMAETLTKIQPGGLVGLAFSNSGSVIIVFSIPLKNKLDH